MLLAFWPVRTCLALLQDAHPARTGGVDATPLGGRYWEWLARSVSASLPQRDLMHIGSLESIVSATPIGVQHLFWPEFGPEKSIHSIAKQDTTGLLSGIHLAS